MSWTEQRFKQAVERGELRFFPRCARSYLYFKAKRGYNGNIDNRNDNSMMVEFIIICLLIYYFAKND